jgi:hypothetical protein
MLDDELYDGSGSSCIQYQRLLDLRYSKTNCRAVLCRYPPFRCGNCRWILIAPKWISAARSRAHYY